MGSNKCTKKEIGKRVAIIREHLGMTQQDFSEHVEISVNFLSLVENGNRGLSAESIAKIAEKTGYSADYILLGKIGIPVIAPDSRKQMKEHLTELLRLLDENEQDG